MVSLSLISFICSYYILLDIVESNVDTSNITSKSLSAPQSFAANGIRISLFSLFDNLICPVIATAVNPIEIEGAFTFLLNFRTLYRLI